MGAFYIDCRVFNHVDRDRRIDVGHLLVDTGSEFTWIHEATLAEAGVSKESKTWTFVMANGAQITRSVGYAIIEVEGVETIDEIVLGQAGDLQLLGSRTLEGLNLRVDAFAKKLVAGGPILAAATDTIL